VVVLERLTSIEYQDSDEKLLLWPESKGKETEVQGSKEKGKQKEKEKQKEERLDEEDEEEEAERGGQEENNWIEGMKEESSRFSPAAYSVSTGSC